MKNPPLDLCKCGHMRMSHFVGVECYGDECDCGMFQLDEEYEDEQSEVKSK
jgi:hypothetical protein